MTYQQIKDVDGSISRIVKRIPDGAFIPDDRGNQDRLAYEAWLKDGNEPLPVNE